MYSSVSEAEYQFRRAKAEEEARKAYDRSDRSQRSVPSSNAPSEVDLSMAEEASSGSVLPSLSRRGPGGILSRIQDDDILLIGILFLLFNENKNDDPLILIILAVLLFN